MKGIYDQIDDAGRAYRDAILSLVAEVDALRTAVHSLEAQLKRLQELREVEVRRVVQNVLKAAANA